MSAPSFQQADVLRMLQSSHTRWLILGINLLLVVWIASLLAGLTWKLVAPPADFQVVETAAGSLPVAADPDAQLIRQLPGWHLMGVVVQKQAPVVVETPIEAPDTRLQLVLHGVFASDRPGKARAIIADPKGEEQHYAVGDMLPGNVELSEVYPDRVILKRNGRFETLRLIQDSVATQTPAARSRGTQLASRQASRISEIRQQIQQSPKTLLQIVRPKPYMADGKTLSGYTLEPGPDLEMFEGLGLLAGDVVTQINDVVLDSAEKGMQALKSIQSGDHATMVILRDGQEQTISFNLSD